MNAWQYLAPYTFWIFIAITIVSAGLFGYLKSRSRDAAIRDIVVRGQPVPAEMFNLVPKTDRNGLLIGGLIMLFIGIALAALGWTVGISHQYGAGTEQAFVGAFPGGIGLALLISYLVMGRGKGEAR